jgi:hypothetical protein
VKKEREEYLQILNSQSKNYSQFDLSKEMGSFKKSQSSESD